MPVWETPVVLVNLRDTGDCCEQDASRLENPIKRSKRCTHVVDQLQRLREDDAVEHTGRDVIGVRQVGNDRRVRVIRVDMEDVVGSDLFTAESFGIDVLADLEYMPSHVLRPSVEKVLDVVTIDGPAPGFAKDLADWIHPAKVAKIDLSNAELLSPLDASLERRAYPLRNQPTSELAQPLLIYPLPDAIEDRMTMPPKMVVDDSPELALTEAEEVQVGLQPLQIAGPNGARSAAVKFCHCATAPRMLTIPAPDLIRQILWLLQHSFCVERHVFVQTVERLYEPADTLDGLAPQHKTAHAEIHAVGV